MKFKENMKINFVGLLCVINVILIFQVLIMKMKLNLLIVQFVKKNDMVLCAHRCINILENGERCKISVKGDTLKKYNGNCSGCYFIKFPDELRKINQRIKEKSSS